MQLDLLYLHKPYRGQRLGFNKKSGEHGSKISYIVTLSTYSGSVCTFPFRSSTCRFASLLTRKWQTNQWYMCSASAQRVSTNGTVRKRSVRARCTLVQRLTTSCQPFVTCKHVTVCPQELLVVVEEVNYPKRGSNGAACTERSTALAVRHSGMGALHVPFSFCLVCSCSR